MTEARTYRERVAEASQQVDAAIEALEAQPRRYGGHLSKGASSVIDGVRSRRDAAFRRSLFRLGLVVPE